MTDHRIRDIVIVGGGTAGWMTAAALARFMHKGYTRITLVESDEIGTVGVGEATIPTISFFNEMLGIDENEFLRATQGTFKLGIEFVDWGGVGERYFHQFGSFGASVHGLQFYQLWMKLVRQGKAAPLAAYSPSAVAASRGRFNRENSALPLTNLAYAFHFDATLYARFLRNYAEQGGVARVEGKIVHVDVESEHGNISSVTLADGRTFEGELFIDCSGFRSLLLGETLGSGYVDWSHWLPCDRAVAVPSLDAEDPAPFTRCTAREAGWQWKIPLQHRTGNGYVYSSSQISSDEAEATLLSNLPGEPVASPRHLSFMAGRRKESWVKNCVSIGLSSGFLEPLESTSIHLIQTGISRLLALFPDRRFSPVERDTFNRMMASAYEGVRDFIILHYKATQRNDSAFWDHCRMMEVPQSLYDRLELFKLKGRVFRNDDELFTIDSWVAVMLGQNVQPETYDPVVDALNEVPLAEAVEKMRTIIDCTVDLMPTHREYIGRHCAAAAL